MTQLDMPKGSRAVMNRRLDPLDSLDFFATPPWATRALFRHVLMDAHGTAWDPCAGEGHMAEVLRETFSEVYASDVHDYSFSGASDAQFASAPLHPREWRLDAVGSFAGQTDMQQPEIACPFVPDWVVINPPFNAAIDFVIRGLSVARRGVAALVRANWAEGGDRYHHLFRPRPPAIVAQFAERVPMVKGCWDPEASTATAYAWFIWDRRREAGGTRYVWIPPGCRTQLEHADDRRRFAAWTFEAPATPAQDLLTREMRDAGMTPREMMAALGVGKDRLTRFLRDIAKADVKEKRRRAA